MYVEQANTPYATNIQKENIVKAQEGRKTAEEIQRAKMNENLLVDLQVYQEQKKKQAQPLADKMILPVQPVALTSVYTPPQFQSYLNNVMKNFYTPFIYKDYNIQIGGPNADHLMAQMIYEDALPPASVYSSYKSLKERNALCDYVRGTFIQYQEGENIDFNGGPRSLNSRLNLLNLNPFNTNYFESNPYLGLSENILIYNSCYPIMYDKAEAISKCQKNSIGVNVRIYRLTKPEALFIGENVTDVMNINRILKTELKKEKLRMLYKQLKSTNIDDEAIIRAFNSINYDELYGEIPVDLSGMVKKIDFNVWREIDYYAFIRNKINKQYISPNFIMSYAYFVNRNANIRWTNRGQPTQVYLYNCEGREEEYMLPEAQRLKYSNNVLVLLTESPNFTIYSWSSDSYQENRNIKTQIYNGFKTENTWMSVVAQLLIAFCVMDKYNFTINQMDLNRNVYIKELFINPDSIQYWRFNLNGIEYYVPNHGCLVLIDSDYHNISGRGYKILSTELFNDNQTMVKNAIRQNAIKCFDPNNFGQEFKNIGGIRPCDTVMQLLTNISNYVKNGMPFEEIMKTCFVGYVHNRVGTQIRNNEVMYINKVDARPFTKGELVIYESAYETYEILLYIENVDNYNCRCAGRDGNINTNNPLVEKIVGKDLLYHYSENEIIFQDKKPGEPSLNLDYLIETYNL